jgi:hypothetical protein
MAAKTQPKAPSSHPPYIDRGEPLQRSYAENRIVALVRSPEQIHLFWDVESEVRVAGSQQIVRVHDLTARGEYDLQPPADADNWYLRVAPNRTYRFELFERLGARLRRLAISEEVATPVRSAGESGDYAPSEVVEAVRHPISRKAWPAREARAMVGRHPARGPALAPSEPRPSEAPAAAPTSAAQDGPPAAAGTAPSAAKGAPAAEGAPPAPIPAPREKVFAANYAGVK